MNTRDSEKDIYSENKLSSNWTKIMSYRSIVETRITELVPTTETPTRRCSLLAARRLSFELLSLRLLTSQIVRYQSREQNANCEDTAQRNVCPQIFPNVKQVAIERGKADAEELHDRIQQTRRRPFRFRKRELRGELETDWQIASHEKAIKIFTMYDTYK